MLGRLGTLPPRPQAEAIIIPGIFITPCLRPACVLPQLPLLAGLARRPDWGLRIPTGNLTWRQSPGE